MRLSIKKGLSFGLTSGVITTLGLMIGLGFGTESRTAVMSGILILAFADALSDALGIHISEETDKTKDSNHIWEATGFTFLSKCVIALTFLIPVLIFELNFAMYVGLAWGALLIIVSNYFIAKSKKVAPCHIIGEHLLIAVIVVAISYGIGIWVG